VDFEAFLQHVRDGATVDDAAALCDVLPDELDAEMAREPDARRRLARAEAEFRARMTRVLRDAAEVNRAVTAARHFLTRAPRDTQLRLDFAGPAVVRLTMPDNGRENP